MAFSAHSSEAFAKHIEMSVSKFRMTYMEAVIDFCEKRQIEPEDIVPFLNDKIRTALAKEGQNLHLIKKRNSLED